MTPLSDEIYMRRALDLARRGMGHTSPNPMVGAVIVAPDGSIIGEGWHRRCGEAHAEVNAVASVSDYDRKLLPRSTIYVTLEPCSHYGKTPPCARLLIDTGFARVVAGAVDPNPLVAGRGIDMLRAAGITVTEGVLADECRSLNARFFTAFTAGRPFVMLKWAQSADGYIDARRDAGVGAYKFSTSLSAVAVHRLRSMFDAVAVGSGTVSADNPRLDVRLWPGRSPRPVVLDGRGRIGAGAACMRDDTIHVTGTSTALAELMPRLRAEGITSVLVEGGSAVLQSFLDAGLWDAARVEVSPVNLGERGTARAPKIAGTPERIERYGANCVMFYSHNQLARVKNL